MNKKRLVSGDAVLFLRYLRLGSLVKFQTLRNTCLVYDYHMLLLIGETMVN